MSSSGIPTKILIIAVILLIAKPAVAFGAGNIASIAKIEGSNWRHGDIEDTLLSLFMSKAAGGKKFDKLNVSRVYFGNWLRDYSQAIDVGTVKYVSAEAIRILLWVLGFMTFGFGTNEFEVTADRLGCYRPEDHIDNPKDYADNVDATQYDARLRGPVDESVELAIDSHTGMKNFIANERVNIMTSALHVRKLFHGCIRLGKSYARSKNKEELYEALRLLGTGLHCLEDFSAHSNYIELALIELGERDVFPHVGRRTQIRLPGARDHVYPLVTGTFGGVDFLHSVLGEFDDKATQSEIQELEGTMREGGKSDTSLLKGLLSKIPKSVFGGKDAAGSADNLQSNATAAQMNNVRISPRHPEQFTRQMQEISRQIYPIIEWHDEIMKGITETIENIPILPDLISKLEEQVKSELNAGSSEIIQSSKDKQFIVFNDDYCNNPTHSMLAKDHFSNVLNEPAGKIASKVLTWVVPQLIQCWDDERTDVDRTINRIIHGVFHHPAQRRNGEDGAVDGRRAMFDVVETWWSSKDRREQNELRQKLSREGIKNGDNHQGVQDTGHGCGHPLKMNKRTGNGNGNVGSDIAAAAMSELNSVLGGRKPSSQGSSIEQLASGAAGGGKLGSLVGAIAGGVGGSLLTGKKSSDAHTYHSSQVQGGQDQRYNETGNQGNQYSMAGHQGGGRTHGYQSPEQSFDRFGDSRYSQTELEPNYEGDDGRNIEGWRRDGDKHHHYAKHHHRVENNQEVGYSGHQNYSGRQDASYSGRHQEHGGIESKNYSRHEGYGADHKSRDDREHDRREELSAVEDKRDSLLGAAIGGLVDSFVGGRNKEREMHRGPNDNLNEQYESNKGRGGWFR